MSDEPDRLWLTTFGVSLRTSIKVSALDKMAHFEKGPVYDQPGGKGTARLYHVHSLDHWIRNGRS